MIQANEVRIGNLVYGAGGGEFAITAQDIVTLVDLPGQCNPIPLTEEWLLGFGFRGIGGGQYKKYTNENDAECFYIHSLEGFYRIHSCHEYQNSATFKIKLEYVNQLQNLYFSLTGTELTLKPQP